MPPINATFGADFTAFNTAVDKALYTLKGFESGAADVAKMLGRMGDQFSGVKIAREASLVTQAVTDLGGASKLTASEQARVNATLKEALEKYKALGKTAPQAMLDLEQATRKAQDETKGLSKHMDTLSTAVGTFMGNLALDVVRNVGSALLDMGKAAFDSAGQIVDLANKTGLSTDAIQEMRHVAEQTGGSLEQFTQASYMLGQRLAGNDKSVAAAIKTLGLSMADLRKMSPDDAFKAIVEKLGEVENATARNKIGSELFGRSFANIAAAVAEGYAGIAEAAQKSGRAQLQALDAAGDAWAEFKRRISTDVTSLLGNMVLEFQAWGRVFETTSIFDPHIFSRMREELEKLKALKPDVHLPSPKDIGLDDLAVAFDTGTKKVDAFTEAYRRLSSTFANEEGLRQRAEAFKNMQRQTELRGLEGRSAGTISFGPPKVPTDLMRQELRALESSFSGLKIGPIVEEAMTVPPSVWSTIGADLKKNLGGAILAAVQGGGNVGGAVGGMIGGSIAKNFTEGAAGKAVSKVLSSTLGKTIGGALGSVIPGLGTMLGSVAGSFIGKGLGKLFGGGEGKKANDLRDQIIAQAGGFDALAAAAVKAGTSIDALLKAKDVKGVEAAWAALDSTIKGAAATELKAAEDARRHLEEQTRLLEKYNVTWADFEGETRATKFAEALALVNKDLEALTAAGLTHDVALRKVGDGYVRIAQEAIAAGQQIPDALAPTLLQLAQMGALTDEQAASLLGLVDAAAPTWAEVTGLVEKYGIAMDELGPKVHAIEIADKAKDLSKDFDLLIRAGANSREVIAGMSEEVNEVIKTALKMGLEVPSSMRDMLQKFVDQGELTDENGERLKDLSRIKFAEPIQDAVQRLIDKLTELIDKIKGTGSALAALPDDVPEVTSTTPGQQVGGAPTGEGAETAAGVSGEDNGAVVAAVNRLGYKLDLFPADIAASMMIVKGRGRSYVTP
jgi:hypothetical protein